MNNAINAATARPNATDAALDHQGYAVIHGFSVHWHPGRGAAKRHVWSESRASKYNNNPAPLDPEPMTLKEALASYEQYIQVHGPKRFGDAAESWINAKK
jgi:hypothetical protein